MSTPARSPLTGTLTLRHVADGAIVAAGDLLAEVECMKTLWQVYAPVAGRVRYRVRLGEVVDEGETVAMIEA